MKGQHLDFVWEFIREWNRIKWNDHKGMEMNGMEQNRMYLSKRNGQKRMEWNEIK